MLEISQQINYCYQFIHSGILLHVSACTSMIMIQVHSRSASFLTFDLLVWWAWSSNDSIHSLVCKDFNSSISTSSRPSGSHDQYRSTKMNSHTQNTMQVNTEVQVSIVSIHIYLL